MKSLNTEIRTNTDLNVQGVWKQKEKESVETFGKISTSK